MKKGLFAGAFLAAAFTASAAWAAAQDFTITNHTGHVIVTLNVSPNSSNQWGPDILWSSGKSRASGASTTARTIKFRLLTSAGTTRLASSCSTFTAH